METRLILIRHGETDDNRAGRVAGWRESELTDLGRAQARLVAAYVADHYRPDAIYASPLRRAHDTAHYLAQRLDLPVQIVPELREMHFGDAEGLAVADLKAAFPDILQRSANDDDLDLTWPNGESRRAFYQRTRRAFDLIVEHHPRQTVAIVTHGGVVSRLLADIAEGRPTRWSAYQSANCSLAEILVSEGTHSIAVWNHTEHLIDLVEEGGMR